MAVPSALFKRRSIKIIVDIMIDKGVIFDQQALSLSACQPDLIPVGLLDQKLHKL